MRKLLDWKDIDTLAEAKALADYTFSRWDGITLEEAQTLALHAFHRGWDAVGDYFDLTTFQGEMVNVYDLYHRRTGTLKDLGYEPRDIIFDKVTDLIMKVSQLSMSVQRPPDFSTIVDPLHAEALEKLGAHLANARLKGWDSFKGGNGPEVTQADKDAFDGIAVRGPGPDFITWTSLQYLKAGVDEHDDDAFKVLVSAMYSHGFKVRCRVNSEAIGATIASINIHQKIALGEDKVEVANIPIARRLLAEVDDIEWVDVDSVSNTLALN